MGWIDPTDRVNGDVLDADLWNQDVVANTLAIFRHLTPVGTVIPYAGDWGTDYVNLADPDVGAPFHLPCTGGIYETADFPLLSRVLGHAFCHHTGGGDDLTREDGWIAGGEALYPGDPVMSKGVYKWDKTNMNWEQITADGFAVPDFRGRSPIGTASGFGVAPNGPVTDMDLGQRHGDWRLHGHTHTVNLPQGSPYNSSPLQGGSNIGAPYTNDTPMTVMGGYLVSGGPHFINAGVGSNLMPSTTVNFLIFTGQVVASHAPKATGLRDGSVHRLQPVTTDHMIRDILADPNLSDEEREMYEAHLAGEPWPPMPEEVS